MSEERGRQTRPAKPGGRPGRRRPRGAKSSGNRPFAQAARQPANAPAPPTGPADLLLKRLLYRDGLVLIIDKPAGLPVHAGPGGGDNVEQYLDALRFGLPRLPALAHRLDRDTSGCLVLGRHHKALRKLGLLFSAGKVDKTYWAIVEGHPPAEIGTIDLPLLKQTLQKGWRIIVAPEGQRSVTDYRVLGKTETMSWLELKPHTGRTHQIRVHCAEIGCPLVGDPAYGPNTARYRAEGVPLHLLARSIALPLYPKRAPIGATAMPPTHMLAALKQCGYRPEADTAATPVVTGSAVDVSTEDQD
ncbi:MAG TPA: RNA pseudouridine synthase [Dongiaceae bacterium]|nr:RNA pseudouridine synthase [Dongiaceae bacterium]